MGLEIFEYFWLAVIAYTFILAPLFALGWHIVVFFQEDPCVCRVCVGRYCRSGWVREYDSDGEEGE